MSFAESVMEEIKNEQPAAAEAAVVEEQPQQEETVVETPPEDPKPEETVEEHPKETETKEESSEEKPAEEPPQPKPDLSQLSKEEKAQHAFQRQLAKQKAKYESTIEETKASFQKQIDDIKKMFEQKKDEVAKTREDFDTDDEFIDYLTQRGVDKRMAQIDADNAKAKAEADAKAKAEAEAAEQQKQMADYFNTNARNAFGDGYAEFEQRVQKGVANGLADVLDEAPAVRDYIFSNPNGPAVLNEMLVNKESFVRVMSLATNPMDAVIECHELAKELSSRKAEPVQPTAPRMPSLGKPGAGGSTRTAPDMYHDDQALIDFVRRSR